MKPFADRFWEKVVKTKTCWNWVGAINNFGYGSIRRDASDKTGGKPGMMVRANRASWEMMRGPIPARMCVLHKCDNRRCVRPSHLFLGTYLDNSNDMIKKGRAVSNKGQNNGQSRLTNRIVKAMRREREKHGTPFSMIAKKFGVHHSTVARACARQSWKHIT